MCLTIQYYAHTYLQLPQAIVMYDSMNPWNVG